MTPYRTRRWGRRIGWCLEAVAVLMAWWMWESLFQVFLLFLMFVFAGGGALLLWATRHQDQYDKDNPYQPIEEEDDV